MRLHEKELDRVIDAVLEECRDWWSDKPVGKNRYHFSVHSRNIDILHQYDYPMEFLRRHPQVMKWLRKQYEAVCELFIEDEEVFEAFVYGGDITNHFSGVIEKLVEKLVKRYRERITETYRCEECGAEISERYPVGHPKHLHRIGIIKNYIPEASPSAEEDAVYLLLSPE